MIRKQPLSLQSIIDCLNKNYEITVKALIPLPLGADMHAFVYKAETQNNQSYFVKLKRGHHHDRSVALLAFLQASGIQQIIPPIKTTNGELTQHISDYTITVYSFIEGQNGFCYNLTNDQWITLGKVLKRIHESDVPLSIKKLIRKETFSDRWREAVRSLYAHIDENLNGDEASLKLHALMKEREEIILHLVDRAEALSQKIRRQSLEFVLCHSDIHGGNVLIDENGSIFIVDWDDPIMAPKERDLMFIGGGVANVWNNPQEEVFFYKGYGKTEINKAFLAYYRYERIVEDIAIYGQALLLNADGGKERLEMYRQFMDMFAPNGVVDIALKTDINQHVRLISSVKERTAALDFRQKHFFDPINIQDPYAWTLDRKDHVHWLLYNENEVIGYAHVQMWPEQRAALRILVIDEQKRGSGMGKYLMNHCEQELKQRNVILLQTEASPNAYLFYKKLGYIDMPFNSPDGKTTHPDDRAMGKYL